MLKILRYNKKNSSKELEVFLNKRNSTQKSQTSAVKKILLNVKKKGDKAVLNYEKKFSKIKTKSNKIFFSNKEVNKISKKTDKKIRSAIDLAYNRIKKFHSKQKFSSFKFKDKYKNELSYKYSALDKVGVYVPANLPSTLMMNAIPAKISQVKNIVLANPRYNGKLNAAVMYVAKKCKINHIISVGGAQAIGSLAYIQRADKIFGPGSDYVARAKREVFGDVGIEGMIAGPSEITVVADNISDTNKVITSLAAQSEHGLNSQSILISKNIKLIN